MKRTAEYRNALGWISEMIEELEGNLDPDYDDIVGKPKRLIKGKIRGHLIRAFAKEFSEIRISMNANCDAHLDDLSGKINEAFYEFQNGTYSKRNRHEDP